MSLAFALPDEDTALEHALEAAEPQAPKAIKPLLTQAAHELRSHRELFSELAEALEHAASLRAGQMASQSRCDEIANEVRQTVVSVAARLRSRA